MLEREEEKAGQWARAQGRKLASRHKRERLQHNHHQTEVHQILNLQLKSKRQNSLLQRQSDLQYAQSQALHNQHTAALEKQQQDRERESRRKYVEDLTRQVRSRKTEDSGEMSTVEVEMNREGIQAARLGLPALYWRPESPSYSPYGQEQRLRGFSHTPSPAKHSLHHLPL